MVESIFIWFALCCQVAAFKQIYYVQSNPIIVEEWMEQYEELVDIWHTEVLVEDIFKYTLYLEPTEVDHLVAYAENMHESMQFVVERSSFDMNAVLQSEKKNSAKCPRIPTEPRSLLLNEAKLVDHEFFNCFRRDTEIHAFMSAMADKHPNLMSKFPISTTVNEATIYGYRLGISNQSALRKPAVYVQALLHAREWLGPPTVIYSMASLLDGIIADDAHIVKLAQEMDFYFVPLVNIDGYRHSWSVDRLWRKNRRPIYHRRHSRNLGLEKYRPIKTYGVDLNRNYGPNSTFCDPYGSSSSPWSQNYCGTSAFSEPEIAGIEAFLQQHPEIVGTLDIHCYGDLVLRPHGYTHDSLPAPHDKKMKTVGDDMADAINNYNSTDNVEYASKPLAGLYLAAGTFSDCYYEMHEHKPSITIELRGDGFVVKPHVIRIAGSEIFQGLQQFTKSVQNY